MSSNKTTAEKIHEVLVAFKEHKRDTTQQLGIISQNIGVISQDMKAFEQQLVGALLELSKNVKAEQSKPQKPAENVYEVLDYGQLPSTSQAGQIPPPLPTTKVPEVPQKYREKPDAAVSKSKIPSFASKFSKQGRKKGGPDHGV
ncbi:hypothetical protein GPALN_004109 [Globodera pallida]|uniref:Conjugal transfer protein TraB n=1 Tax=Globodera pallida TaxID=36090 RepID=A0A183BMC3_GLOPA|nr:hypothetical protein GPALN_004109 [Globodera pallida]